jgi:phospholipid/cholesterol/gamma-HCH transport system permease protein
MLVSTEPIEARATTQTEGTVLVISLEGRWSLESKTPRWGSLLGPQNPSAVSLRASGVSQWDTSLVVFLGEALRSCSESAVPCDVSLLPEKMRDLARQFEGSMKTCGHGDHSRSFVVEVGLATRSVMDNARDLLQFVGEFWIDTTRLIRGRAGLRWNDCLNEMQRCGAMALPIVSLISFLVGVTLAYSGAIVLKRFGGEIWVADLIGVAMTREMGALMAAITLSGRTGAAFAAEIGSMKANEEIDALSTLGISPVRFLVIPRVLALGLMMPLLAMYANCLGILGGMAVSYATLDIPPTAYWVEMLTIVDTPDFVVGITKSVVFGLIVGLSGCLRGLQADRTASGVGKAATSAVVTAILLIIVADAIFAILFHAIGL